MFWTGLGCAIVYALFWIGIALTPKGSEAIEAKTWAVFMIAACVIGFMLGLGFAIRRMHKHVMGSNLPEDEFQKIIGKILP